MEGYQQKGWGKKVQFMPIKPITAYVVSETRILVHVQPIRCDNAERQGYSCRCRN